MSRVRLNATALRLARLPGTAPPGAALDSLFDVRPSHLQVTRREAVAIAGVAAAAVAGATGATPALGALGPVNVKVTARGARFTAGRRAFAIEPARFGGAPKLAAKATATGTQVALSGATFPGTMLPADVTVDALGSGASTRLRIRMRLGGFDAEVPLAKWLAGETAATSAVTFSGETCPLKGLSALKFSGSGRATLTPDWTLKIQGASIARVSGLGKVLLADTATISLPLESEPTLFSRRIKRRTLVVLERGSYEWALTPPSGNGAGSVALAIDTFDRLTLEAAETADGYPYRAVVAVDLTAEAKATFGAKALRGLTGKPASVPLAAARYARAFDVDGESFMLAADFLPQASWVYGSGYAMLVGAGAGSTPFEMTGAGKVADHVVCQPAIQAVSVPMGDAIVEPIRFPQESGVALNLGTERASAKSMSAQAAGGGTDVIIIDQPGTIILPPAASVTVTRPEDMLRLRFEFHNMALATRGGALKLVRRNAGTLGSLGSTLVVVFPPQHILESAFEDPHPTSAMGMRAAATASPENSGAPPIWNTIAGESRLAFSVPSATADAGIPYTLTGLLDWSKFELNVVETAQAGLAAPTDRQKFGLDGQMAMPGDSETSLELPWGIYLSPSERAQWDHKKEAQADNNVYELWHTRYVGDKRSFVFALGEGEATQQASPTPMSAAAANVSAVIGPVTGVKPPIFDYVMQGLSAPALRAVWARYYDQWLAKLRTDPLNSGKGKFDVTIPIAVRSELTKRTSFSTPDEMKGFRNRWSIVDITAKYRHDPISVRRLMLTSQGAWMNILGTWPTDEYTGYQYIAENLLTWEHRTTQGRDQYVKIVKAGRLYPFGHKAAQVTVTERKLMEYNGRMYAYLLQRDFIIVREKVKNYRLSDFPGVPRRARQTPLKSVEIKTHATPPIKVSAGRIAGATEGSGATESFYSYWIRQFEPSSNPKVMFDMVVTDWDGNTHDVSAPLIFVMEDFAAKKAIQGKSILGYVRSAYLADNAIDAKGQVYAYAEPLPSSVAKDTRHLPTDSLKFTAEILPASSPELKPNDPLFHPMLSSAKVRLDVAEQITNQSAAVTITLAEVYLNNGYSGPNAKGMAFANVNPKATIVSVTPGLITSLDDGGLKLPFPGSQAGGLATPSNVIKGLSAYAGPFGGAVDAFADGFGDGTSFNPGDFFGNLAEAKLIGGVTIIDLLTSALGLDDIPGFTKEVKDVAGDKQLVAGFNWVVDNSATQKIKKFFIFEPTSSTALKLKAEMTKSLTNLSAEPSSVIEGSLSDFYINLIGDDAKFLNLVFGTFTFSSINGGSPKINPGLEDVLFAGPLQFLNELRQFLGVFGGKGTQSESLATGSQSALALGSFNIGPFLVEFDTTGLYISISIAIPNISVGVMALSNMSLGAKISLLWDGSPILVDFNFCTKESQMTISVCGWGGGGYVLLRLATGAPVLRKLEIGFWFGATASIDIVVASGSVEIKGGFTFTIETAADGKESLKFEAYIRLSGRLDILGIIKISLTFELVLTYEQFDKDSGGGKGDKLTGTATLTVEIEILFFSFSVDATVSQEIAGTDPRFGQTIDAAEWATYCKAFAPATLGA